MLQHNLEAGLLMQLAHGRQAPLQRVPLPLLVFREIGAVEDDRLWRGRQRDEPVAFAPQSKLLPIVLVSTEGGGGARGPKTGFRLGGEAVERATGERRQRQIRVRFRGSGRWPKAH